MLHQCLVSGSRQQKYRKRCIIVCPQEIYGKSELGTQTWAWHFVVVSYGFIASSLSLQAVRIFKDHFGPEIGFDWLEATETENVLHNMGSIIVCL